MVGANTDIQECIICMNELSNFDNDEPIARLSSCPHIFHANCVEKWRVIGDNGELCPVCRVPMNFVKVEDCNVDVEYDSDNNNDDEEEEDHDDDEDEDDNDKEEPSRRSMSIQEENNQQYDMHWPVMGEQSLPSSPHQGWSNHASYPPNSCHPQWGMVAVSYVPVAQPHGEWGAYENHPQSQSVSSAVVDEPPVLVSPWWQNDVVIVVNKPQSSRLQLPVTEIKLYFCLVLLCLFLLYNPLPQAVLSLGRLFDGVKHYAYAMAVVIGLLFWCSSFG